MPSGRATILEHMTAAHVQCTLGCVFIRKSENLAYATPKFDVGAYTEQKNNISRIFLAPLPMGHGCFVKSHFRQFCPMAANKGENMFFQTKLTHPIYY